MGLAYPFTTLEPAAELLRQQKWSQNTSDDDLSDSSSMALRQLNNINLELSVQLRPSRITTGELGELQPGDVIQLNHWKTTRSSE